MTSKINLVCIDCGAELNDKNWYPSFQKRNNCLCKNCDKKRHKQWKKANPNRAKATWTLQNRKQGHQSMNKNKECPQYLGIYVAESVLSQVFKNVERMPMHNPGYDFICGQGYKVDVKSSCLGKFRNRWQFGINHNIIADYFLCLAFDNRQDLNPLHMWLLPGDKFNHLMHTSISPHTIHRWDEYWLDVAKVATCCNAMKGESEK